MPYIIEETRQDYYEDGLDNVANLLIQADDDDLPGELNFVITHLVKRIMQIKGERYRRYNAIIGALECCKLELYRRMVGPYEDKAIERNGDV